MTIPSTSNGVVAFTDSAASSATLWAQGVSDITPQMPTGEFGSKISLLLSWLMWGSMAGAVMVVMAYGVLLGAERLGRGSGEAPKGLFLTLVGCVVTSGASGLINGLVL